MQNCILLCGSLRDHDKWIYAIVYAERLIENFGFPKFSRHKNEEAVKKKNIYLKQIINKMHK